MPASKSARELISRISRAQHQFKVDALGKLYPGLRGPALNAVLAREARFDAAFAVNSRARITRDVRAAQALPAPARAGRLETIARQERRYLQMHIEEAGRRMACEAEMHRLWESGADGGVWILGKRKRHTADCLRMAGRYWPRSVLEAVNPANRHAGCGCRIVGIQEARRMGVPIRNGRASGAIFGQNRESAVAVREGCALQIISPRVADLRELGFTDQQITDELLEAAWHVPVHVGSYERVTKSGKRVRVKEYIRHIWVEGDVPASMDGAMEHLLDASATGDHAEIQAAHTEARKLALKIRDTAERDLALRTIDRARSVAFTGGHRAQGGVQPLAPVEKEGIHEAWGADGRFLWEIPDGMFGANHAAHVADLRRSDWLVVKGRPGGPVLVESKKGLEPWVAQMLARDLEIRYGAYRTARMIEAGVAFESDAPLEVHDDQPRAKSGDSGAKDSDYRNVSWGAQGDAGELMFNDVTKRLVALGALPPDALSGNPADAWTNHTSQKNSPLDWVLGADSETCFAVEVKTHAFRNQLAGRADSPTPSIDKDQARSKRNDMAVLNATRAQKGLPPAIPVLVQVFADLDTGVGHVTMTYYGKRTPQKEIFTARRVPGKVITGFIDGTISPGDTHAPTRGTDSGDLSKATTFVGSFPLRFNPLRKEDGGVRLTDLTPTEVKHRLAADLPDADVLPAGARITHHRPPTARQIAAGQKQDLAERDKAILAELRLIASGKSDKTVGELGKEHGITGPRVTQIKNAWNEAHPKRQIIVGKGKRTDLAKKARKKRHA